MADKYSSIFAAGFVAGLIIRWTDILPILGGFVLGLTIHEIPSIVSKHEVTEWIKDSTTGIMDIYREKVTKKKKN